MGINLETLADNSKADRNFRKLAQLVLDTGGQDVGVRFGTGTATWPGGSQFTNTVTITHGLGRTPIAVVCTCITGGAAIGAYQAFGYTSTTFAVKAQAVDGGTTAGSQTFAWVAIG